MIRIRNTRTGKTTEARDGKDAARILQIESDRRTGAELAAMVTPSSDAERDALAAQDLERYS
jgi:hypothetical protein